MHEAGHKKAGGAWLGRLLLCLSMTAPVALCRHSRKEMISERGVRMDHV
jgi:hypothetical protein